jgi:ABC-2 type transport system ATP-binding protein
MINVQGVVKSFGTKVAVDKISFEVERGEVLGFLGPNGAGKSTTMRVITGFFGPDAGKVTVGGHDIAENPVAAKKLMGYLPENAPAYSDMPVQAFLNFAAEIRGLSGSQKKKAVDRAIEMCFLEPVRHQSVDTLSKGYRHRTCFAQSIVHDPDVLILDEPTDGLDPNQKHEVRNLIRQMGEKKAIIFSTHILEEVDAACTRAVIIDRGKIVANGTPEELRGMADDAGAVRLALAKGELNPRNVEKDLQQVEGAAKARVVSRDAEAIHALVYPKKRERSASLELSTKTFDMVRSKGWKLLEMRVEPGRLDHVFRKITHPDRESEKAA